MITFQLEGTNLTYINEADWPGPEPTNQALDGNTPHNRYMPHVWRAEVMTIAEYDNLFGYEGSRVSITTSDYDDRNNSLTYYGVDFKKISGNHDGPSVKNVEVNFLVRL